MKSKQVIDPEFSRIIERGGGRFVGLQEIPGRAPLVLFNDPLTETTLGLNTRTLTIAAVRHCIAESRRRYQAAGQLVNQPGGRS